MNWRQLKRQRRKEDADLSLKMTREIEDLQRQLTDAKMRLNELRTRFTDGPQVTVDVLKESRYDGSEFWYAHTMRADNWIMSSDGHLAVLYGGREVATYVAGQWRSVQRLDIPEEAS